MPPFYYDCPICNKKFQQGQLGKHLLRYKPDEINPYISNLDKVEMSGAHPEILCSGRTYVFCPKSNTAYEKVGGKLEKNHSQCKHKYNDIIKSPVIHQKQEQEQQDQTHKHKHNQEDREQKQDQPDKPVNTYSLLNKDKLINLCKAKGLIGYSGKKHSELVSLLTEHDIKVKEVPPESICYIKLEEHVEPKKQICDCSKQIGPLQTQLDFIQKELELYKTWAQSIIATNPLSQTAVVPIQIPTAVKVVEAVETVAPPVNNPKQAAPPKINKIVQNPTVPKKAATVKASKKEIEKGLWCTKCESCHNTAQFATDLKPCQVCNKLCHKDSDLYGCYHWDCAVCDKKICKECNKAAGGNKLFSFCSISCKKRHTP
jgi:hypothetical protein